MSQLIASASDSLQIWEFVSQEDCKSLSKCTFTGLPKCLTWNHTNQVVAVGLSDKKVELIQATTGQLLSTLPFTPHDGILSAVRTVKFSGNSRYLASTESNSIQLWDLKKRALKTKLVGHRNDVVAVSFFADGTIAAGDCGGAIRIWDVKTDDSYREMNSDLASSDATPDHASALVKLTCMELSLSGPGRVAAGYSDGSLSLWDPITLTQLRRQMIHKSEISAIAFSPKNPRLVATSSYDGRMSLVDTGSKSSDASASIDIGGKLTSITFHEDAIHCAVGTDDGRILFYDWRNVRKPIVAIESSTSHPVHALAFQVPKIKADAAVSTPIRRASTSIITSTTAGNSVTSSPTKDSRPLVPLPQSPRRGTVSAESAPESTVPVPVPVPDPVPTVPPVRLASSSSTSTAPIRVASEKLPRAEPTILSPVTTSTKRIEPTLNTVGDTHDSLISNVMNLDDSLAGKMKPAGAVILLNTLPQKDNEESDRRTSSKNVTSAELSDALLLMKYDFHRELQILMREQVRQFAIAKDDTSKLFLELNTQLQDLLLSNKELRAENDQLRRIY